MNSVKTNWEATEKKPVGTIPRRRNHIFRGSEGETEHGVFKVESKRIFFVFNLALKAVI